MHAMVVKERRSITESTICTTDNRPNDNSNNNDNDNNNNCSK